jgi:Phosphotransferase enzyme family
MRFLRSLRHATSRVSTGGASFSVDGVRFTGVAPLWKPGGGGPSKAGHLAWRGEVAGRPVKISEYPSEEAAVLVEAVSADPALGRHFPAVMLRRGNYLVAEWVEGETVRAPSVARDDEMLREIAAIQAQIHGFRVPADLQRTNPSYRAVLEARFRKYASILPLQRFKDSVGARLDAAERRLQPALSHPDFTPANLIRDGRTGYLVVVDNELMASHSFPQVDLLNTHRALEPYGGSDLPGRYVAACRSAGGGPDALASEAEAYEALWALRVVGSHLQRGALSEALTTADEYLEGRQPAHPLIHRRG